MTLSVLIALLFAYFGLCTRHSSHDNRSKSSSSIQKFKFVDPRSFSAFYGHYRELAQGFVGNIYSDLYMDFIHQVHEKLVSDEYYTVGSLWDFMQSRFDVEMEIIQSDLWLKAPGGTSLVLLLTQKMLLLFGRNNFVLNKSLSHIPLSLCSLWLKYWQNSILSKVLHVHESDLQKLREKTKHIIQPQVCNVEQLLNVYEALLRVEPNHILLDFYLFNNGFFACLSRKQIARHELWSLDDKAFWMLEMLKTPHVFDSPLLKYHFSDPLIEDVFTLINRFNHFLPAISSGSLGYWKDLLVNNPKLYDVLPNLLFSPAYYYLMGEDQSIENFLMTDRSKRECSNCGSLRSKDFVWKNNENILLQITVSNSISVQATFKKYNGIHVSVDNPLYDLNLENASEMIASIFRKPSFSLSIKLFNEYAESNRNDLTLIRRKLFDDFYRMKRMALMENLQSLLDNFFFRFFSIRLNSPWLAAMEQFVLSFENIGYKGLQATIVYCINWYNMAMNIKEEVTAEMMEILNNSIALIMAESYIFLLSCRELIGEMSDDSEQFVETYLYQLVQSADEIHLKLSQNSIFRSYPKIMQYDIYRRLITNALIGANNFFDSFYYYRMEVYLDNKIFE